MNTLISQIYQNPLQPWSVHCRLAATTIFVIGVSTLQKRARVNLHSFCFGFYTQAIFLFSLVKYQRLKYEDYVYPGWAEAIGWMIALGSMLWIPGVALVKVIKVYCQRDRTDKKVGVSLCSPYTVYNSLFPGLQFQDTM